MTNIETGTKGEELAAEYLLKNGYEILERNKRFSRFSEIDIIAKQKSTLVFVEVKTRKNRNLGSPFEAITPTKYSHIKKGLFTYLQENKGKFKTFRIDAISVVLYPELKIEHLKNI